MAQRLRGRFGYPKDDPFRPTVRWDRLHEPSKRRKPAMIFVCSMGELLSADISPTAVRAIIYEMRTNPEHIFQVLTKNPAYLDKYSWPRNVWLGVTVTKQGELNAALRGLSRVRSNITFISFEPLLGPLHFDYWVKGVHIVPNKLAPRYLDWAIIGAMTGPGAIKPDILWVSDLLLQLGGLAVPAFVKDNARPYTPEGTFTQIFPTWVATKEYVLENHHRKIFDHYVLSR